MNYGEIVSSKGVGVYRIFDIISVVRITTTSVDGVHACNICTKNSYLLRAGRFEFQAPVKARFSVPMQRSPDTPPPNRQHHACQVPFPGENRPARSADHHPPSSAGI
jgi:hypothetical protein